jgi:hypothetical protein
VSGVLALTAHPEEGQDSFHGSSWLEGLLMGCDSTLWALLSICPRRKEDGGLLGEEAMISNHGYFRIDGSCREVWYATGTLRELALTSSVGLSYDTYVMWRYYDAILYEYR